MGGVMIIWWINVILWRRLTDCRYWLVFISSDPREWVQINLHIVFFLFLLSFPVCFMHSFPWSTCRLLTHTETETAPGESSRWVAWKFRGGAARRRDRCKAASVCVCEGSTAPKHRQRGVFGGYDPSHFLQPLPFPPPPSAPLRPPRFPIIVTFLPPLNLLDHLTFHFLLFPPPPPPPPFNRTTPTTATTILTSLSPPPPLSSSPAPPP